jgi:L-amino acid N-acyltransferase
VIPRIFRFPGTLRGRPGPQPTFECIGGGCKTTLRLRAKFPPFAPVEELRSTAMGTARSADESTGQRPTVTIRLATASDAASILEIYNYEVENRTSTFDIVPRTLDAQRVWLAERSGAFAAVVATIPNRDGDPAVVGFASLSPYKERAAYRTTVENSVYVSREHGGLGIGRTLMEHLIEVARDSGFHSIIARIEASSEASRALHRACGFVLVGVETEVGRKFNRWLSTAVMQLML